MIRSRDLLCTFYHACGVASLCLLFFVHFTNNNVTNENIDDKKINIALSIDNVDLKNILKQLQFVSNKENDIAVVLNLSKNDKGENIINIKEAFIK